MKLTDVRIFPSKSPTEKIKAYATIVIEDSFMIRDIRIIETRNGLIVAMPSKKLGDGTFQDIAHPVNRQTRDLIESTVLSIYNRSKYEKQEVVGQNRQSEVTQ